MANDTALPKVGVHSVLATLTKFFDASTKCTPTLVATVTLTFLSVSNLAAADPVATCELKLHFVYDSPPPEPRSVIIGDEAIFCGDPDMVDESLQVDATGRGIANVVAWVESPKIKPSPKTRQVHTITCQGCRFDPHVVLARAGDSIQFSNRDVFGHVVQANFFDNSDVVVAVPMDHDHSFSIDHPERSPAAVTCQLFPWMTAYLVVAGDRPTAVSGPAGELTLAGLPVGRDVTIRLWHESGRFESVRVDGDPVSVERGRLRIGLGSEGRQSRTITLPASAFGN